MAAAIQPSTTPFTKAYLVKHENRSARVAFLFDKSTSSLTVSKINFWKSKEIVHLNLPLADDPDVTPQAKIMLYKEAVFLALEWSKYFPLEKPANNSPKTILWNATISFFANSSEEAFILWFLIEQYPHDDKLSFARIVDHKYKMGVEMKEFFWTYHDTLKSINLKKINHLPCTEEEDLLLSRCATLLKTENIPRTQEEIQQDVKNRLKQLRYPQKLSQIGSMLSVRDRIEVLKNTPFDEKVEFYIKALDARPPTNIEEMD